MRKQGRRDTRPELRLRSALHRLGLRFRVEVRVLPDVRRTVDIAFTRQRVAVLVMGCFWHSCPDHATRPKNNSAWWSAKLAANEARDRDTLRRLEVAGWTPIVVWEHEDLSAAAARIAAVVRPTSGRA
ncbi:DNA mismatch endonuclease Vsr [Micromonospora sp. NPDC002296]|uniref:very short patch repair endonuclease n=1 Tax=Micromonospora sp. NPDC002296 TaxID=3154271 RepID=UPI00332DE164